MADEENVEQKQQDAPEKTTTKDEKTGDSSDKKSLIAKILPMLIILIVAAIGAAGGFTTARVVAAKLNPKDPNNLKQAQSDKPKERVKADDENGVWYYQHEPVVSCLDEDDVKRYIRATLTFAISSSLPEEEGKALFKEKTPLITNYLTIYLASLNLDSVRGGNNLRKIRSQICDDLNEKLFPDQKHIIKEILFKEWAIQ
ncbi:MAG: flagellar basal body-associated FliL family protein [Planctomycetota bacterium]|jgi:flagellar basal body-associated protein FliL